MDRSAAFPMTCKGCSGMRGLPDTPQALRRWSGSGGSRSPSLRCNNKLYRFYFLTVSNLLIYNAVVDGVFVRAVPGSPPTGELPIEVDKPPVSKAIRVRIENPHPDGFNRMAMARAQREIARQRAEWIIPGVLLRLLQPEVERLHREQLYIAQLQRMRMERETDAAIRDSRTGQVSWHGAGHQRGNMAVKPGIVRS